MSGTRLDLVLSAAFEEFSRSFIQKLFENETLRRAFGGRLKMINGHLLLINLRINRDVAMKNGKFYLYPDKRLIVTKQNKLFVYCKRY